MKKFYTTIALSVCALASLTSCKDFLTVAPINEFSSETYFASESECELYANGFINSWLPSLDDGDQAGGGNGFNDLIATKASTDYLHEPNIWGPSKQTGWSTGDFNWARRVNFMIEGMNKNGGSIDKDIFNHYMGVARFWRAQRCWGRTKTFINAKWIDKYLQPDDTVYLWKDRDDHEMIMKNILEDLKFAAENVMLGKFHQDSRAVLDKYVVLAWASRICLYEGTYLKYHEVNPATGKPWKEGNALSKQFLQAAYDFSDQIIKSGDFSLHPVYRELFMTTDKLCTDECIWGRVYGESIGLRHNYTRYFNSSTLGQQYSGTKELVRMFLKTDGTPANPNLRFTEEFKNRDTRLGDTVLGPDFVVSGSTDPFPNFLWCMTGYQICKWFVPDATHLQNAVDCNSLNYFRYAEILLNKAEAEAELNEGIVSAATWKECITPLRERGGVTSIYPGDANYVPDTWLIDYYTKNVNMPVTLTNYQIEIRRERVTELTYECGLRQDDLYRWRQAELMARRHSYESNGWTGLWISKEDYTNGFKINDHTYYINKDQKSTTETTYRISQASKGNWTVEEGDGGYYLLYHYPLGWHDEYMYCRPIPQTAMNINKNLTQTYGWENKD